MPVDKRLYYEVMTYERLVKITHCPVCMQAFKPEDELWQIEYHGGTIFADCHWAFAHEQCSRDMGS